MNVDRSVDSIFTKIIDGQLSGVIAYRDEHCIVLMDAYPILPGHVLVIPLQQHVRIRDMDDQLRQHLFEMANRLTQVMADIGLSSGDTNILVNDGRHSGQSVPHVHIHVVPRNKGDGFPFPALLLNIARKLIKRQTPPEELERVAERLRSALSSH